MQPKLETVLIYGKPKIGKTSQAYHMVKAYHKKYPDRVFRVVSTEPGNNLAPFEDSGMVDAGIVQICDLSATKRAFADLHRVARGYWPLEDGTFETTDRCKTTPKEWKRIGGYIVEGLTSMANLLLNHCSDQVDYVGHGPDKGWKGVGFKPAYVHSEDDVNIVGLQPGHYGIVQKEVYKLYVEFTGLPMAKDSFLLYTALVGRGDEDMVLKQRDGNFVPNFPIYGPKLVGNAATNQIPSWFRHTIHLDDETLSREDGGEEQVRVGWYQNHANGVTGVNYLAGARVLPELYPNLMDRFKGGYVQINFTQGIVKYFSYLEKLRAAYQEKLKSESNTEKEKE